MVTDAWPTTRRRMRSLGKLRTPVLVVAAALFGAAFSAAVLVGFWDDQVQGRRAVESRLATSQDRVKALTAENANLRAGLAASLGDTATLKRSLARIRAETRALTRQNAALLASARQLHGRGDSLQSRAASVSKLAATLGSDVANAVHYLRNTPIGSFDPAYLKAQLDYLGPAVTSIEQAAAALAADAGGYAAAVDALGAR